MTDKKSGMGASVGVKKRDKDDNIVETSGDVDRPSKFSWFIFFMLVSMFPFGIWKVVEIVLNLV